MNSYIFVVAAVVSVFSVYYVLNRLINEVKTDQVPFEKTQKKFLIGIFLSKIIPLIFLFYGIFKMTPKNLSDLYIPWTIIGIAAIIGLVLIEKFKKDKEFESILVGRILFGAVILELIHYAAGIFKVSLTKYLLAIKSEIIKITVKTIIITQKTSVSFISLIKK